MGAEAGGGCSSSGAKKQMIVSLTNKQAHTQPTNRPTNQPSIRISRSGAPDRVNLRTAARAWYLPGTRPPTAHVPTIP